MSLEAGPGQYVVTYYGFLWIASTSGFAGGDLLIISV